MILWNCAIGVYCKLPCLIKNKFWSIPINYPVQLIPVWMSIYLLLRKLYYWHYPLKIRPIFSLQPNCNKAGNATWTDKYDDWMNYKTSSSKWPLEQFIEYPCWNHPTSLPLSFKNSFPPTLKNSLSQLIQPETWPSEASVRQNALLHHQGSLVA